jgi:hypothetical protein
MDATTNNRLPVAPATVERDYSRAPMPGQLSFDLNAAGARSVYAGTNLSMADLFPESYNRS